MAQEGPRRDSRGLQKGFQKGFKRGLGTNLAESSLQDPPGTPPGPSWDPPGTLPDPLRRAILIQMNHQYGMNPTSQVCNKPRIPR